MDSTALLQNLVKELDFIENLYDVIRLVDPVQKKVHSYLKSFGEDAYNLNQECFGFWERGTACENCISMRAYNQKKTIIKIEDKDARVYMVTSVPVDYRGSMIVTELIKDITNDGVIDIAGQEISDIRKIISRRNSLIIKDALTRIYNENFIFERLPYDIAESNKRKTTLALFRIKINNLEAVNSMHGDMARDYVIKEITKVLRDFPRNNQDWLSRYRGNEFLLLMHDINDNQVKRICKRIYNKIRNLEIEFENNRINVQINLGYDLLNGQIIETEQFINNAGKNLYELYDSNELYDESNVKKGYVFFLKNSQLTTREKEVALLLLKGKSNVEIAKILYVGLSTVKKHVSSIFNKTKVNSRAEFISKAGMF
ncbi:MAG: diguanylate cyclase domain-containing protein [Bacillota bacterium]|jgi:two-component system cell cycle response regulator